MSKFDFKLESVLNLRIQVEKSVINELSKAIGLLKQEEEKLETLIQEKDSITNQYREISTNKSNPTKLYEYRIYNKKMKQKIIKKNQNLNLAQKNVDNIRVRLAEAVKERKVLEKLKEKKLQEYMIEENKKEQKIVDEIVGYRYTEVEGR